MNNETGEKKEERNCRTCGWHDGDGYCREPSDEKCPSPINKLWKPKDKPAAESFEQWKEKKMKEYDDKTSIWSRNGLVRAEIVSIALFIDRALDEARGFK